ncbi:MAG TPA: septum site-determining protein MinC [Steroidobacteraceae bacterium]|nr:septum site-determining protein MinC [Steroidobacteraceae bacterium]
MMTQPVDAAASAPAIDIRFGQVGLIQVRIRVTDPGAILDELTGRVASAPLFFRRTGAYLDLSVLGRDPELQEIRAVMEAVRRAGMLPVGLVGNSPALEALSAALELPVLAPFKPQTQTVPLVQAAERAEPFIPALMQHQPVRSGQRLYARSRDLVVTSTVGAGAEAIADGCVHIYGSLRGRAVAGARGETSARVFCQEFRAELVSVAGVFRVFETLPPELAGKPVQAWLDGDQLRFAPLSSS